MNLHITTKFNGSLIVIQAERDILAKAFCRVQEHYESPFDSIRGQIFTLGQLRILYPIWDYHGGNHVETRWAGYNIPDTAMKPFINGLFDPLNPLETDLVNILKYRTERFYVIGASEENDETLDHEICHSMFYLFPKYKKDIIKAMSEYDLTPLKKAIAEMGYCEEVLEDECHAYLSANYEEWFGNAQDTEKSTLAKKHGAFYPRELHDKLRAIKVLHTPKE